MKDNFIDPEIIKPDIYKKYRCLIHHMLCPRGEMYGEVYCMSGFFVCEGNIALSRSTDLEDIYAYRRI